MMNAMLRYLFLVILSTGITLFEENNDISSFRIEQTSSNEFDYSRHIASIFDAYPAVVSSLSIFNNSKNLQSAWLKQLSGQSGALAPEFSPDINIHIAQVTVVRFQHRKSRTLSSEKPFISLS
ncbi:hypothetical protein [Dyadobacter arcticus]|uniref:Uncharacterized protein n=1 Tax=Dyadobacter arcticus TaxID=1078754 RepID=A0ABX0UJP2_9BACT|nr:hypothetical protein [Dyadobacter arcticus]NIJ51620.1 hypothetical protein [Dyadobacter arcticus]